MFDDCFTRITNIMREYYDYAMILAHPSDDAKGFDAFMHLYGTHGTSFLLMTAVEDMMECMSGHLKELRDGGPLFDQESDEDIVGGYMDAVFTDVNAIPPSSPLHACVSEAIRVSAGKVINLQIIVAERVDTPRGDRMVLSAYVDPCFDFRAASVVCNSADKIPLDKSGKFKLEYKADDGESGKDVERDVRGEREGEARGGGVNAERKYRFPFSGFGGSVRETPREEPDEGLHGGS